MAGKSCTQLPPGFRFHPTDEELIMYYLRNQAMSRPCPVSIIPEVDIYKFDPWDLPDKSELEENEWYFFSPRDRKYPNGVRPNRATVSGYWKATGTDKAIYSGSKYVGVKKALVFYKGRPPKGTKTGWIMHEYRLIDKKRQVNKHIGSMRLDDWVLCRIYKKKNLSNVMELKVEDAHAQTNTTVLENDANEQQHTKIPRTFSLTYLVEMGSMGSLSHFFPDSSFSGDFSFENSMVSFGNDCTEKPQLGDMTYKFTDSGRFDEVNHSSILQQPLNANPSFY